MLIGPSSNAIPMTKWNNQIENKNTTIKDDRRQEK